MFLSRSSRFPHKSTGGPILGFRRGANCPQTGGHRVCVFVRFCLSSRPEKINRRNYSGAAAIPEARAGKAYVLASPHGPCRFTVGLSAGLPPRGGRRGIFTGMARLHCLQVLTRITRAGPPQISARSAAGDGEERGSVSTLRLRAVDGAQGRPKCQPPEPRHLASTLRFLLPEDPVDTALAAVPPLEVAEFEQRVLMRARTRTGRF